MAEIGLVFEFRKPSMRVVQNEQMTIGEVDVSKMSFDYKSRDDIPKILGSSWKSVGEF